MSALPNVIESVRPVLTVINTPPAGEVKRPERAATEAEWQLAVDIRAIGDELSAVEDMLKEKKAALAALIGEYRVDLGPEGSAFVVHVKGRSTIEEARLRSERPDLAPILDAYTKTGAPSSYVKVSEPTKKQRAKAGK